MYGKRIWVVNRVNGLSFSSLCVCVGFGGGYMREVRMWIMGRDDIYRDRGWLCFFLCLFIYVLVGVVYV